MGSGKRVTRCEERAARARSRQCRRCAEPQAAAPAHDTGHGQAGASRRLRAAPGGAGQGRGRGPAPGPAQRSRRLRPGGHIGGGGSAPPSSAVPSPPSRAGRRAAAARPQGPGSGTAREEETRAGTPPPRPDTPLPSARGSRCGGTGAVPGGDFPRGFCGAFWWSGPESPLRFGSPRRGRQPRGAPPSGRGCLRAGAASRDAGPSQALPSALESGAEL